MEKFNVPKKDIQADQDLFNELSICVLINNEKEKDEYMNKLWDAGAMLTQNYLSSTDYIISTSLNHLKLKSVEKYQKKTIL